MRESRLRVATVRVPPSGMSAIAIFTRLENTIFIWLGMMETDGRELPSLSSVAIPADSSLSAIDSTEFSINKLSGVSLGCSEEVSEKFSNWSVMFAMRSASSESTASSSGGIPEEASLSRRMRK